MNKASVNEYLCEDTTILIATGKERSSLNVLFKGFSSGILVKSLNYTTKKAISAWSYDSINGQFHIFFVYIEIVFKRFAYILYIYTCYVRSSELK